MTKHKISMDGIILAVIAGLLLQTMIYNVLGINVAEVPVRVILILWGILAGAIGRIADLTGF